MTAESHLPQGEPARFPEAASPADFVKPADQVPYALTDDAFEPLDPVATEDATILSRRALPGPGLPEALGWMLGLFMAHIAASVALMVLIVVLVVANGQSLNGLLESGALEPSYMVLLVGGDQALVLLIAMVAASLRFSGRLRSYLNLRLPHPLHVCLIAGLMLPLASLSGELYRVTAIGWAQLVSAIPELGAFDASNTVEWLKEFANVAPLPVMLLIFAVGPALGEELIFRGVIGRGLVARWGLWTGVLLTSLMFAVVHGHPVHVIGVIPLGIAMHLVYLATRSFWAPVLLHFLNNSWATIASRAIEGDGAAAASWEAGPGAGLLVASVIAVIVLGVVLYRTRTRYVLTDGTEWSPGYVTTEAPPAVLQARLEHGLWNRRTLATAATAWVSFAVAFVAELVVFAR